MARFLTSFTGLASTGTITGVPDIKAGDLILGVHCSDNGSRNTSFFDTVIVADGEVTQVVGADLSAVTMTVLVERAVLLV